METPTDAVLYHPGRREDWPQPLLSSHEEEPGTGIVERQTPRANTPVSDSSTADLNTDGPRRSAAHEESADLPSEWPESVMAGLRTEWSRLWQAFQHDVNVATNSLLYMLEDVHLSHLAERRRLKQAKDASGSHVATLEDALHAQGDTYASPTYPTLRALPALAGEPLFRRSAPDGPMEQTLMKAWLIGVYGLWESPCRNQLEHEIKDVPGSIRPRQQVLGELGYIRNDLVHNNGIAKRRGAARCETLRWFREGEHMRLRIRHVLDFLNQMGWLHENPTFKPDASEKSSAWNIDREGAVEQPAPALVSVRPLVNPEQADPRYRYEASIVFENGVFGRTPWGPRVRRPRPSRGKEPASGWK